MLVDRYKTLWVASEFCRNVFRKQFPDGEWKVLHLHATAPPSPRHNLETKPYIFYTIGNVADPRKNINALIRAYNAVPLLPNIPTISKPTLSAPSVSSGSSISGVLGGSIPNVPSVTVPSMTGGGSSSGGGGGVAAAAASAVMAGGAFTDSQNAARLNAAGGAFTDSQNAARINLTVNQGIVGDPEGAARSIVDVLNRSYGRGALGAEALFI
jgi:hypothetical protein